MKLISCHIDGFGKLSDVDINFDKGLNNVCQENGYGKTTLAVFIKSMFYGLGAGSRKNSKLTDRTKYQPFNAKNFGGSLSFSCKKGKFVIRREFNKTVTLDKFFLFDAETNLPSNAFSENIGEELFGVGKDTFDATIFFGQHDLKSEANDTIKASLSVGELYGDDMDNLSNAMDIVKSIRRDLKNSLKIIDLDREKSSIERLYLKENEIQNKIEKAKVEIADCENKLNNFSKLKSGMERQQNEVESWKNKKVALEFYISEIRREQEKNTENTENIEKSEKNPKKFNKKQLFMIITMLFGSLAMIGLILYFVLSRMEFIIGFGVFLALMATSYLILFLPRKKKVESKVEDKENFKDVIAEKNAELEEINKNIEQILGTNEKEFNLNIQKIQNDILSVEKQKTSWESEIKHLQIEFEEVQNDIQEAEDVLEDDKQKYLELTKKTQIIDKTEEFLLLAANNLSRRYVEPVQQKFDEFYKKFFIKDDIIVDANLNMLLKDNYFEEGYLSAGLLDLVHICKRFALIDLIYKNETPFVVLDDPFVNLDDKNLDIAKKIVQKLSEKYQIIFLTCHSSRRI